MLSHLDSGASVTYVRSVLTFDCVFFFHTAVRKCGFRMTEGDRDKGRRMEMRNADMEDDRSARRKGRRKKREDGFLASETSFMDPPTVRIYIIIT